jgi:GTP-binding protein
LKIEATFVRSAANASDLPRDGFAEIALVGRSNVGKSSLINALVRQRLARTSAAPGKTRLANLYRVARSGKRPVYLVDLPGYGYAQGRDAAAEFEAVAAAYFGRDRQERRDGRDSQERRERQERRKGQNRPDSPVPPARPAPPALRSALLLIDSRHPGLQSDVEAWRWLRRVVASPAIVATKIDKLSRAERLRAMRTNEAVFEEPVLPVSAVTGEGLDELWKLIDRLANSRNNPQHPRRSSRNSSRPRPHSSRQRATALRPPKR